jgi:predicted ATPase
LLIQQISPAAIEEQIFSVVNQLNYGIALIEDQTERDPIWHNSTSRLAAKPEALLLIKLLASMRRSG